MRLVCLSLIVLGCGCTEISRKNSSPITAPLPPSSKPENFDKKLDEMVTCLNEIIEPSKNAKVEERRKSVEKSYETVDSSAIQKNDFLLASAEKSNTKKAETSQAMPTCDMPMGVLPSARGCCDESAPYVMGSFLYWRGQFTPIPVTSSQVPEEGNRNFGMDLFPNFEFNPGFKIGLGYNFSYDAWDLLLDWTWFRGHSHKSFSSSEPIFMQGTNGLLASQVEYKGHVLYNSIDLELGRVFFVGKRLSLRPFTGGKTFWFKHSEVTDFNDVIEPDSPGDVITDVFTSLSGHTWAIGPRVGINSRWILGKSNFALLTNMAGSLIWQKFHESQSFDFIDNGKDHGGDGSIREGTINPVAEIFFGVDWGTCFSKSTYLNFSAGYEVQYFANQYPTNSLLLPGPSYTMMGLTASFRLDF